MPPTNQPPNEPAATPATPPDTSENPVVVSAPDQPPTPPASPTPKPENAAQASPVTSDQPVVSETTEPQLSVDAPSQPLADATNTTAAVGAAPVSVSADPQSIASEGVVSPAAPSVSVSQPAGPTSPVTPDFTSASDGNHEYKSNPYLNTAHGIVMMFKKNPATNLFLGFILILGVVIAYFGLQFFFFNSFKNLNSVSVSQLLGTISIIYLVMGIFMGLMMAAQYAIAGASARDESITVGEALGKAARKLLPLIGLFIISGLLALVGFLLLIVPGLIFLGRASLSVIVMMEENLGPIAALKRSFVLTKGHVFEMYGSYIAGGLMSGSGLLALTTLTAPVAGRYHDLRSLEDSGGAGAPKTHWLNYFNVALPFIAGGIYAILFFVLFSSASNGLNNINETSRNAKSSISVTNSDASTMNAFMEAAVEISDYESNNQGAVPTEQQLNDPSFDRANNMPSVAKFINKYSGGFTVNGRNVVGIYKLSDGATHHTPV